MELQAALVEVKDRLGSRPAMEQMKVQVSQCPDRIEIKQRDVEWPKTHVRSAGSKAQTEPSGKFVCRGPIHRTLTTLSRQKPHALTASSGQENAVRKVAARSSPEVIEALREQPHAFIVAPHARTGIGHLHRG